MAPMLSTTRLRFQNFRCNGFLMFALCIAIGSACAATGSSSEATSSGAAGAGGGGGAGAQGGTAGGGLFGGDDADKVPQTCSAAAEFGSYLGCEFWPTVTSNNGLDDDFEFTVVVTNPTQAIATIEVKRAGDKVAGAVVSPGQLTKIQLPWVTELKQSGGPNANALTSVLLSGGGYQLTSDVPVSVHQFSPFEFQHPNDSTSYSHSNDASLLLPSSVLSDDYYVLAYPTFHAGPEVNGQVIEWIGVPGFASVTATEDGTVVSVTSSAHVRPGPGVSALSPGDNADYMMNAGDVLLLMSAPLPDGDTSIAGKPCETHPIGAVQVRRCPSPVEYDLSGTHITSTKPISVLGGHDCTFIPYNRYACDHLEESMMPTETLGDAVTVAAPFPVASIGGTVDALDNMFVRILSATANNTVSFEPAIQQPVTLEAGGWTEIGPIKKDVHISADNKILVTQYLVGEEFSGTPAGAGDPAQSLAIPNAQYREAYAILAPDSFTHNFVNIIAPSGAAVTLDGSVLSASAFVPVGSSGYSVLRQQINGGAHALYADEPFGIVVYGYAKYASYMYPGGLDLQKIVIPPK